MATMLRRKPVAAAARAVTAKVIHIKEEKPVVAEAATSPATPIPSAKEKLAEYTEGQRLKREASEALATIARYKNKVRNPKTAIRAKCIECSGGSVKEVNECPVTACALYPFRMGENPFNKKTRERLARESGGSPGGDGADEDDDE